jgi:GT2 family glycosyltransferase
MGGFDETYAIYSEDTDRREWLALAGWEVVCTPRRP